MTMRQRLICCAMLTVLGLTSFGFAQTSYPMVHSIYPAGGQRGKTVEIQVSGYQLNDAIGALFEGTGVKGEIVKADTVRVTIDPDAKLGAREFRLVTKHGVSSVAEFIVSDDPEVLEMEPNNTVEQAQKIDLPVVINGKVQQGEDVDCFKFTANAGDRIAFSVVGRRRMDKIHDLQTHLAAVLTVTDASGKELTASWRQVFKADPAAVYTFDKPGDYIVQIRDKSYGGNPHWVYRLTVTKRPFVLATFPMALKRGTSLGVEFLGFNLGGTRKMRVDVPEDAPTGLWEFPARLALSKVEGMDGTTLTPVPLIVTDDPEALESEPNDTIEQATRFTVPGNVSGRLEKSGDVDYFIFSAQQGQALVFETEAHRFGSPVDSFLTILDMKGSELANGEDVSIDGRQLLDSRIEWTAPTTGDYIVRVKDLTGNGGEHYVYHLTVKPLKPDFRLRVDPDKINIAPGESIAVYVQAQRIAGFNDEIQLQAVGLPQGITATPAAIPANVSHAVIIFTAAPDAPQFWAGFVQVVGTGSRKNPDGTIETITRVATPMQEIYFPGGGRGLYPVNQLALGVTEPPDIVLEVDKREITLAPGEEVTINVKVKRHERYKQGVTLDVHLRHLGGMYGNGLPPGVIFDESKSKTLLGANEMEGRIVLRAADNAAPIQNWNLPIGGNCSINFVVKIAHYAPPIKLSIIAKK